ncbi:universal stress protein [Azospirillum thermophilum]|nr:universal stress protein [Azospirillum thermophilum]
MKSILIATDLSARSDRALDRALALAREQDARITVLHVVDDRLAQAAIERREDEAKEAIAAYLAARGPGQDATVSVTVGEADSDILRAAGRCAADLIVLGAHRVAPDDDTFQGSTAWNVLRESRHPVLLVKEPALAPYRRVAVGFDFSGLSEAALRLAFRFRPGEVDVMHVFHAPYQGFLTGADTQRDLREQCDRKLESAVGAVMRSLEPEQAEGVALRRLVCRGEIVGTLRQECETHRVDLLAIGTSGRSGLAHAIFGSIAESLLRDPPCDIVAVRGASGA